MRVAGRIVGVLLLLAGLSFLVLFVFLVAHGFGRQSVLWGPDRSSWIAGSVLMVAGVGFILAGRSFLKLDVDEFDGPQPASRFALLFIAHRRELKIIAQAGLLISVIRLAATSLGDDWPGRWATFPLYFVSIGLLFIAGQIARGRGSDHLDWEEVPERVRPFLRILWKSVGPALGILVLLFAWSQLRHQVPSPVLRAGFNVVLFAWPALFFAYGEMRADL